MKDRHLICGKRNISVDSSKSLENMKIWSGDILSVCKCFLSVCAYFISKNTNDDDDEKPFVI